MFHPQHVLEQFRRDDALRRLAEERAAPWRALSVDALWDLVFGTYRPVEAVRVPRRLEMRWLTDPDTGDVWPPLRGTYSVYGR